MEWTIKILAKAEKDLAWFRQHNKTCYVKCFNLLREIAQNPRNGKTGTTEIF